MKETLKRDLNKTYLILSSEGRAYEESYEIEMIVKNAPETILPLHVLRVDKELQLFYDVSAKQSLEDCVSRAKMNRETIYALFEAVDKLKKDMKDYLLDMECVVLDLAHIYRQEGGFYFCYCPWEKKDILKSFRNLLEEILGSLDYHDTEGVELAYHLYQSSCKGNFHISEILKEHEKSTPLEEEPPFLYSADEEREFQEESLTDTKEEEQKEEKKQGLVRRIIQFFMKKPDPEPEDDFADLNGPYEESFYYAPQEQQAVQMAETESANTVLLNHMPAGRWKLRPLLPEYEEFCITEESFLIGKKREAVDGYIGRETVSRIHSRLAVREGRLFISDANSTNGTFVNGVAIEPGKDVEIFAGDRILFADVGYECYNSL